jgi:hypothetical protein
MIDAILPEISYVNWRQVVAIQHNKLVNSSSRDTPKTAIQVDPGYIWLTYKCQTTSVAVDLSCTKR